MSNLFNKNIEALQRRNKDLADRLVSHIVTEIPQLTNKNNSYNLFYKNTYLHNEENPLGEAQEIFAISENTPVTIHLIYGIGLGYLFQYSAKFSQGTIILLEEDLNILKIAFTLVDFSNEILQNNVFITDKLEQCEQIIYQKSNTKNIPLLLSTNNIRTLNITRFNEIVDDLTRIVGSYNLDLKYTRERFLPLINNIITNIPSLVKETPLKKIKDIYKGKTAVIVSAGPTLDKNIETIKKYRESIILIVVGSAFKTIIKNNITPDFLCVIEAYDSSQQFQNIDLSNINFITEPYSNPNLRKLNFKHIFSHISNNMPVNNLWKELFEESIEEYISKGTVSYTAINAARILGCSKIVMVGQDLAYIAGQCYSKESAYKDLICSYNKDNKRWEITAPNFDEFAKALYNNSDIDICRKVAQKRLKDLNNSLYFVRGINGDKIPTESVYAAFIRPLTEFTIKFDNIEYINTSMVGAQIDGFANIPLEEALKETKKINNRELDYVCNIDVNNIKVKINKTIIQLKNIINNIEIGEKSIVHLKNDIKRYKTPSIEVLKSLKKASKIFLEISESSQNTIFEFLTSSEKNDLDYEMKITKNFDINTISNLSKKLSIYFSSGKNRSQNVIVALEKCLGEI